MCREENLIWEKKKFENISERWPTEGLNGDEKVGFPVVIFNWTPALLMFSKLLDKCTLQVKRTELFWINRRLWGKISVRFSMSPAGLRMIVRYDGDFWLADSWYAVLSLVQVAQSSDGTCYNNLASSQSGHRTLKLDKVRTLNYYYSHANITEEALLLGIWHGHLAPPKLILMLHLNFYQTIIAS